MSKSETKEDVKEKGLPKAAVRPEPKLLETKDLALCDLRIDGGTQSRASMNLKYIEELAQTLHDKGPLWQFPAGVAFFDGTHYWVADGFHRRAACERAGRKAMTVEIYDGSVRDAILFAAKANDTHGLRRRPEDILSIMTRLLKDKEWKKASIRWLADTVGVSFHTAKAYKEKIAGAEKEAGASVVTGRDGKEYPTSTKNGAHKETATTPAVPDMPVLNLREESPVYDGVPNTEQLKKTMDELARDSSPKDAAGTMVPKHLHPVFADVFVESALASLETIKRHLDLHAAHYPTLVGDVVLRNGLDQAQAILQGGKPWVVCTPCAGVGCSMCSMRGYLTRAEFEHSAITNRLAATKDDSEEAEAPAATETADLRYEDEEPAQTVASPGDEF